MRDSISKGRNFIRIDVYKRQVSSTLDAMVSTLMIGQNLRNTNSAGQPATGTFIMGLGTLNATAIVIGQQDSTVVVTTGGAATGTLSLKGGSIITTTLTLADKKTNAAGMAQALTSNFNFYSGTLNATTIQRGGAGTGAGANSATINFNWVDGTIGNVAGADMIVSGNTALNGLTGGLNIVLNNSGNTSGTHAWNVSGTQTATLQNTVTLSGAGAVSYTHLDVYKRQESKVHSPATLFSGHWRGTQLRWMRFPSFSWARMRLAFLKSSPV